MKKLMSGLLVLSLATLVCCVAGGAPPAGGVWGVEMNAPLGDFPAVLTLNEDGTGTMAADALGEAPIDGIVYDGNMVTFTAEVDAQGQTLVLEFVGTVEGGSLEGAFDSDFGSFGFAGTLQQD